MKTKIFQFKSTPEEVFLQRDNMSIIVPWEEVVKLFPNIFSVANIFTLHHEPTLNISYVLKVDADGQHQLGREQSPELAWVQDNFDLIFETLNPLFTQAQEAGIPLGRDHRAFVLHSTDILVLRHIEQQTVGGNTTLSNSQYSELLSYRQLLRDMGQNQDLSKKAPELNWPTIPSWLNLPGINV